MLLFSGKIILTNINVESLKLIKMKYLQNWEHGGFQGIYIADLNFTPGSVLRPTIIFCLLSGESLSLPLTLPSLVPPILYSPSRYCLFHSILFDSLLTRSAHLLNFHCIFGIIVVFYMLYLLLYKNVIFFRFSVFQSTLHRLNA